MRTYLAFLFLAFVFSALLFSCEETMEEPEPPSTDATLSGLSVSDGQLTPSFQSDIFEYHLITQQNSITVSPFSSDSAATTTVNGELVERNSSSSQITLSGTYDTVNVVVTAADMIASNTYKIFVQDQNLSFATLSSLQIISDESFNSRSPLEPDFSSENTEYNLISNVSELSFIATSSSPNAEITINSMPLTSGIESDPIQLDLNHNTVEIVVTSGNGVQSETYSFHIVRNAYLPGRWDLEQTYTSGELRGITETDLLVLTQSIEGQNSLINNRFGLRENYSFDNFNSNFIDGDTVTFILSQNPGDGNLIEYFFYGLANIEMNNVIGSITLDNAEIGSFSMEKTSDDFEELPTLGIQTTNDVVFDGSLDDWENVTQAVISDESGELTHGPAGADITSVTFGKNTNDGSINFLLTTQNPIDTLVQYEILLHEFIFGNDSISNDGYRLFLHYANSQWYVRSYSSLEGSSIPIEYEFVHGSNFIEAKYPSSLFQNQFSFELPYVIDVKSILFEDNTILEIYDDLARRSLFYFE